MDPREVPEEFQKVLRVSAEDGKTWFLPMKTRVRFFFFFGPFSVCTGFRVQGSCKSSHETFVKGLGSGFRVCCLFGSGFCVVAIGR